MNLTGRVEEELKHMIEPGDHVVVGVSGGADSVALLICLDCLKEKFGLTLEAVHVNHGIRGEEADRDEAFVREMCASRNIPFRCVHVSVPDIAREQGLSLEEAGRICRYKAFHEIRREWQANHSEEESWIAAAHHRDDQAETILLNLIRGSGIRGLSGMEAVQGHVIRPFLSVGSEEIRTWLTDRGQDWMEDSTNADLDYARNQIRHRLIPLMREELNPRVVEHLVATADQLRDIDDYLQDDANKWIYWNVYEKGVLPAETLMVLHSALRRRILMTVLCECAGQSRDLTQRHVDALDDLLQGGRGRRISLPCHLTACREEEVLRIQKAEERDSSMEDQSPRGEDSIRIPTESLINGPVIAQLGEWEVIGEIFPYTGQKIPDKEYTKWFDYDIIKDTVYLRRRMSGDTIRLAGVGTKPLRRYMIDAHIPAEERDRIPVLADGSHVMWLVGYRMSSEYQIHEGTKNVLAVTCRRRMQ